MAFSQRHAQGRLAGRGTGRDLRGTALPALQLPAARVVVAAGLIPRPFPPLALPAAPVAPRHDDIHLCTSRHRNIFLYQAGIQM
jgi:hypothetical protein